MVRRQQQAAVLADAAQQRPELPPRHRVHARRRLVEHDEFRRPRQRDGHGQLALLAAAQFGAEVAPAVLEVEHVQQRVRVPRRPLCALALEHGEELDVLAARQPREEDVVLRAHAQRGPQEVHAALRQDVAPERGDALC